MDIRFKTQGQLDLDPATTLKSGAASSAGKGVSMSDAGDSNSIGAAQDTASISRATAQLSEDTPIRQDRVDSLRAQIEGGTYVLNPHAIATAMFQNLFRS